jgi:hypothetical protein
MRNVLVIILVGLGLLLSVNVFAGKSAGKSNHHSMNHVKYKKTGLKQTEKQADNDDDKDKTTSGCWSCINH